MNSLIKPNTSVSGPETRSVDRLFDELFDGFFSRPAGTWMPAADVSESTNHVDIRIDVPGIKKDDIEITLEDGYLAISGHRDDTSDVEEGKNAIRRERRSGSFTRRFAIGDRFDAEKIRAEVHDGVLHLFVPKAEAAVAKRIKIA